MNQTNLNEREMFCVLCPGVSKCVFITHCLVTIAEDSKYHGTNNEVCDCLFGCVCVWKKGQGIILSCNKALQQIQ